MSNIILGYPNRANSSTFAGGSWVGTLPVSNLATREIAQVARSSDTALVSTRFTVDLTQTRSIKLLGLVNHNLSQTATWRIKGSNTAVENSEVFDTGDKPVWTMYFGGLVEWESVSWWIGIAGDEYLRSPYAAMVVLPEWFSVRYLTIEITDLTNPDGYVQVGRFFAGNAIQPQLNADFGLKDSWEDLSTKEYSESGAMFTVARRRLRSVEFMLSGLSPTEAQYFHEIQRLSGTIDEILYVPYPDDMGESQRYGFLGHMVELSPIEYPRYNLRSLPIKIKELG